MTIEDGIRWSQFGVADADPAAEFVGLLAGDNVRVLATDVLAESVFVPAQDMSLASGSPAISFTGTGVIHFWTLDANGLESVGCRLEIPEHWTTFDITVRVLNATAVAGNVVLRADVGTLATGATPSVSNGSNTTVVLPATQYQIVEATLRAAVAVPADRRIGLVINRFGADGLDTLAGDLGLIEVRLVRAT